MNKILPGQDHWLRRYKRVIRIAILIHSSLLGLLVSCTFSEPHGTLEPAPTKIAAHLAETSPTGMPTEEVLSPTLSPTSEVPPTQCSAQVTFTPTPFPTPTPVPMLMMGQNAHRNWIDLGRYDGVWSPTSNDLFLVKDTLDTLKLASPPYFDAVTVATFDTSVMPGSAVWSPDGETIVFNGPLPGAEEGFNTLWRIDKYGKQLYPLKTGAASLSKGWGIGILGWMDNRALIYFVGHGSGLTGIEAQDIFTGDIAFNLMVTTGVQPPHGRYIVIPDMLGSSEFVFDTSRFDFEFLQSPSPPYLKTSRREGLFSNFQDWKPGTNTILLVDFDYEGKDRTNDYPNAYLSEWNLDTDRFEQILPNGVWAEYAADGKFIVYATLGPAQLDAQGKPLEFIYDSQREGAPYFLNVYDILLQKVVFSSPVWRVEETDPYALSPKFKFPWVRPAPSISSDGRFLVYLTPVQGGALLNVFDLARQKNVFTQQADNNLDRRQSSWTSTLFLWSPDSQKLVYRDQDSNPTLLYLDSGQTIPLTSAGGIRVDYVSWSFDSRYLLVSYRNDLNIVPLWLVLPESAVIDTEKFQ